jgi:hypothetical protein
MKERREEYRRWVQEKWETAKKTEREQEEGNVGAIRMALGESPTTINCDSADDQFQNTSPTINSGSDTCSTST